VEEGLEIWVVAGSLIKNALVVDGPAAIGGTTKETSA
jgi:hypothetical protein